jgi:hypothetical protein
MALAGRLTVADVAYITSNFFTLEELCVERDETPEEVRALIEQGQLPRRAYELEDGSEWFPACFFSLCDDAGSIDRMRDRFAQRLRSAGGTDDDVADAWTSYLGGEYFWCLREATPENMMRKEYLVTRIADLLEHPESGDPGWRARLRRHVWSLDAIERPFAPDYDRDGHIGAMPSWDRLVASPRDVYPEAFASPM